MSLVGMLHHRKHPTSVRKAYPFAAVAKMEGIDFFYFSYRNINFSQKSIAGWVYERGQWLQKNMNFPDVIINSSSPRTKKQSEILNKLQYTSRFTSHSVGNKMTVYNKILKGSKFAEYLIPSLKAKTVRDVLGFLKKNPKAVFKPIKGNHGKNISFLEKKEDVIQVVQGKEYCVYKPDEFEKFISSQLNEHAYLIQSFVDCRTKAGLTYDFRLHVQKNGKGEWEITLIYPRVSGNSKLISNISSGGYRAELLPFLKEEFAEESQRVYKELENFALSFAEHFDSLYEHPFDELGIDVGLEEQHKLRIFEVNWRPGSKHREFEVARRLLPYCEYLANG